MISQRIIKFWLLPLALTSLHPLFAILPYEWKFHSTGRESGSKRAIITISKYFKFYVLWTTIEIFGRLMSCLYIIYSLLTCSQDFFDHELFTSINIICAYAGMSYIQIWTMR